MRLALPLTPQRAARQVKELKEEEEEFGQTEKFVTSAYKAQLLANKQHEEEQRMLDELKAKDDVRNKDSMSDFFANMLKGKNKASGAIVREDAATKQAAAPTLGDLPDEPLPPVVTDFASAIAKGGEVKEEEGGAEAEEGNTVSLMPNRVEAGVAGESASEEQGAKAQEGGGEGDVGSKRKYDGWVATSYGYVKERKEVEKKEDVKKDVTEVLSAKERFLQRKQQKIAAGDKS